jgi:lysophospholipase L1-like esterase
MIWNEILCLGDSLTYGARDEFGRSFPVELASMLGEKTGEFYVCHNHGINGETSSDLLRRAWNILKSNRSCKIATLLIGTNDTKLPMPIEIYEDNMRQLISSIKANGMRPIIATLPPLKFSPYYAENRHFTETYSNVVRKLANEYNLLICDLGDMEDYLIDGVHFGNKGYTEIASRFCDIILNMGSTSSYIKKKGK